MFVTVLPTVLVIVLISIVIYIRREAVIVLVIGLLISLAYIISTIIMSRLVWPNEAKIPGTEGKRRT